MVIYVGRGNLAADTVPNRLGPRQKAAGRWANKEQGDGASGRGEAAMEVDSGSLDAQSVTVCARVRKHSEDVCQLVM